jgi:aryl carrier-like protein
LLTNRLSLMELAEHSSFAVWDQLLKKKKKTFA